jgi:hypothetical protein
MGGESAWILLLLESPQAGRAATTSCGREFGDMVKQLKQIKTWIMAMMVGTLLLPLQMRAQFTYTTNQGTITITSYTGHDANVTISSTINGQTVVGIGALAFSRSSLVSVSIPSGVTNIGDEAFFECYELTNISVASGNADFLSVGGVLYNKAQTVLIQFPPASASTAYLVPATVKNIGDGAFFGSSLTEVTIPDSVTNIGQNAFSGCRNLTDVIIPASVIGIGDEAFAWCQSLTNISVTPGNENYVSVEGVLFDKAETALIQFPSGSAATAYTVPAMVNVIGDRAFFSSSLTGVSIPSSVTNISQNAFGNCRKLANVVLPASVLGVGDEAFAGCESLTNISVAAGNPNYVSLGGVLYNIAETVLIQFPAAASTSYTIPGSVTNIGDGAFSGAALMTVTIPNNVQNIGNEAFWECYGLTNLIIGTGVHSIGEGAFESCSALTAVTIPNNVQNIGDYTFEACSGLTNVVIGSGVTSIGMMALFDCYNLTRLTLPNSVTNLGNGAFQMCNSLTSVTIGTGMENIGESAFEGCTGLMMVTIPDSVQNIGDEAFDYCIGLTNLVIGNGVQNIGTRAFEGCAMLTKLTIPNSVIDLGNEAFGGCNGLTSVTIGSGVKSIGWGVFYDCTDLTNAFFLGNAPLVSGETGSLDTTVFLGEIGTVYYLPGATGWQNTFGGWDVEQWDQPGPVINVVGSGLGMHSKGFNFTVAWVPNTTVVVQACTNLAHPVWVPVATNTLIGGALNFSDSQGTNTVQRFYRVGSE